MQHFCFLDLSKEQLCSILVFGNVRFNKVVHINHDNVASRGAVGRTHIIVRSQTWNRRKDHGTENFGGFVYVLDGFPQHDFVLWVFMYPINIILFLLLFCVYFVSLLFHGYHAEGYHAPSLPPRAITPVYASRLKRHSIFPLLGYHARAITLHQTSTSGYHTRHSSSYFVVYLSPANTPPVLLIYTTTGAPHVPTYSTKLTPKPSLNFRTSSSVRELHIESSNYSSTTTYVGTASLSMPTTRSSAVLRWRLRWGLGRRLATYIQPSFDVRTWSQDTYM